MKEHLVVTVSEVNSYIKSILDSDMNLVSIFVKGEISNFVDHYKSGHLYFSLKDNNSVMKALMFSNYAKRIKFKPKDGMSVIARGRISLYEPSGQYQMYVEDMQPCGLGALSLAFEQLKEKLFLEGLFDEALKKPIPKYPQKIGIITSDTGAAIKDIKTILNRRYPLANLVVCPVLVQGQKAPLQIASAIEKFNKLNACDVIILGRGGGSIEDLWAFNEEVVARAVFSSKIPIISAVGHETDFTICDFVADLRAPTPSAAAELVSLDIKDIYENIKYNEERIKKAIKLKLSLENKKLDSLVKDYMMKSPLRVIEEKRMDIDLLYYRAKTIILDKIAKSKENFACLSGKLEGLSPLSVIARGYALVLDDNNNTINSIKDIKINQQVKIKISDGNIGCTVNKKWSEKLEKTNI